MRNEVERMENYPNSNSSHRPPPSQLTHLISSDSSDSSSLLSTLSLSSSLSNLSINEIPSLDQLRSLFNQITQRKSLVDRRKLSLNSISLPNHESVNPPSILSLFDHPANTFAQVIQIETLHHTPKQKFATDHPVFYVTQLNQPGHASASIKSCNDIKPPSHLIPHPPLISRTSPFRCCTTFSF